MSASPETADIPLYAAPLYVTIDGVEYVRNDYANAAKVAALEQIISLQRDRDTWKARAETWGQRK